MRGTLGLHSIYANIARPHTFCTIDLMFLRGRALQACMLSYQPPEYNYYHQQQSKTNKQNKTKENKIK
jgi:hypothetical protein